ncbi:MAG: hypothetical protein HYR85_23455 [Planctomycetes bacterium]|nr:hypothetical protein [Planctomycetota bacterium]MBI3847079.1 hypothetical protein [Planctomycetota bacterium]
MQRIGSAFEVEAGGEPRLAVLDTGSPMVLLSKSFVTEHTPPDKLRTMAPPMLTLEGLKNGWAVDSPTPPGLSSRVPGPAKTRKGERTMRLVRVSAFAGMLLGIGLMGLADDDEKAPTPCPEHRDLVKVLDEHLVDAEKALASNKLEEAAARQKQILDDLDKIMNLHAGQGG